MTSLPAMMPSPRLFQTYPMDQQKSVVLDIGYSQTERDVGVVATVPKTHLSQPRTEEMMSHKSPKVNFCGNKLCYHSKDEPKCHLCYDADYYEKAVECWLYKQFRVWKTDAPESCDNPYCEDGIVETEDMAVSCQVCNPDPEEKPENRYWCCKAEYGHHEADCPNAGEETKRERR